MKSSPFEHWDIETAKETYGIEHWGNGYFNVSDKGEVVITCPLHETAADGSVAVSYTHLPLPTKA